jgi:hypothetical protein
MSPPASDWKPRSTSTEQRGRGTALGPWIGRGTRAAAPDCKSGVRAAAPDCKSGVRSEASDDNTPARRYASRCRCQLPWTLALRRWRTQAGGKLAKTVARAEWCAAINWPIV